MGDCQNYGPFSGPQDNTAPSMWGTQKGTLILTTTHMSSVLRATVAGVCRRWHSAQKWVAVKEFRLGSHNPEAILFAEYYPPHGNYVNYIPQEQTRKIKQGAGLRICCHDRAPCNREAVPVGLSRSCGKQAVF